MTNIMAMRCKDSRVLTIVVLDPVPSDAQAGDVVQSTLELTAYEEAMHAALSEDGSQGCVTTDDTLEDRIDDTSDPDAQPLPVLSDVEVRVASDCDVGDEDFLVALVDSETWRRRVGVAQPRCGVD